MLVNSATPRERACEPAEPTTPNRPEIFVPYRRTERRLQHLESVRRRLVAAAANLFVEQGYHTTTTRQIVDAAESSMGNLYFYFPTKEAILRAVVEEASGQASQAIDDALSRLPSGPTHLAAGVYVGALTLLRRPRLARLLFVDARNTSLRAEIVEHYSGRVKRFFAAHPDVLHGFPIALAAEAWQGAVWQVIEHVLLADDPPDAHEVGVLLVRWNLRALGFSPQEIETAVELVCRGDAGAFKSTTHRNEVAR